MRARQQMAEGGDGDGGGGHGGEGHPIFFLDSSPIYSQEWEKKKKQGAAFSCTSLIKRFTSREKAELARCVLQRAETQATSTGIVQHTLHKLLCERVRVCFLSSRD